MPCSYEYHFNRNRLLNGVDVRNAKDFWEETAWQINVDQRMKHHKFGTKRLWWRMQENDVVTLHEQRHFFSQTPTETHFLQQTHSWIRVLVSCNDPSKVCWTASCMLLWLSPPWFQPPHLDLLTQSTHSPVAAFTRTPLLCQSVVLVPLPAVWMPNCPWAVY